MVITGGTYSVYIHTNIINFKRYVGTTSKVPVHKRWCIASSAGYRKNKRFQADIDKYGWHNFEHEIVASGLNEEEASNMERILIKELNTTDPEYGYNTEHGGLRKNEAARRKKISKSVSGENHPAYGTHLSEERRKRIGDAMRGNKGYWYGKKLPQETTDKMSKALKGRACTEAMKQINEQRKRSVFCVETSKEYESIMQAERETGISHVSITRVAHGKQMTAGGLHWEFV